MDKTTQITITSSMADLLGVTNESPEKEPTKKTLIITVAKTNDDAELKNYVSNTDRVPRRNISSARDIESISKKYNKIGFELETLTEEKTSLEPDDAKKRQEQKEREQKLQKRWLKVHTKYLLYAHNKADKLRRYIYDGIAISFKGMLWKKMLNIPELTKDRSQDYQQWKEEALKQSTLSMEQIDKDIQRTFKMHSLYRINYGSRQTSLFNLLAAYSHVDRVIGYTQGMNELAALLIMYMSEEDAFWAFIMIINSSKFNMRGFYLDNLPLLEVFNSACLEQMKIKLPSVAKHFEACGYDISIFTTKWFMCLFIQNFPIKIVLRLWDIILYEGSYVLIAIALTLIAYYKHEIMKKDMEELSVFFKVTNLETGSKFENFIQELKKLSEDFKKNGIKDKIDRQIRECVSGKDSTISIIVKEFEEKEIIHADMVSSNENTGILKPKHSKTSPISQISKTAKIKDSHSMVGINSESADSISYSTSQIIQVSNKKLIRSPSRTSNTMPSAPSQRPPETELNFNQYKDNLKKYVENMPSFKYTDSKIQSNERIINTEIYNSLNSNLKIAEVSNLVKQFSQLKSKI